MSLRPTPIAAVPEETARIARAAFPKGTLAMRLHDELGTVFDDAMFAALYPSFGQPALAPWRLALVSVLHGCEGCRRAGRVPALWISPPCRTMLVDAIISPGRSDG